MKRLIALLICAAIALSFSACADKNENRNKKPARENASTSAEESGEFSYLGTWLSRECEYNGKTYPTEKVLGNVYSFTLYDGGKITILVSTERESGEWKESKNGIVIENYDSGDTINLTLDEENRLVWDFNGALVYFEKE